MGPFIIFVTVRTLCHQDDVGARRTGSGRIGMEGRVQFPGRHRFKSTVRVHKSESTLHYGVRDGMSGLRVFLANQCTVEMNYQYRVYQPSASITALTQSGMLFMSLS